MLSKQNGKLQRNHLWMGEPSDAAKLHCHFKKLSQPPQHQRLFQWVSSSHEVARYWSFSFSISPSKEIPGLISFRMDWLGLLAVQGTLKSLLQHHSSKASILLCSAFFTVQLSHPYMTTGKTIALTQPLKLLLVSHVFSRYWTNFQPASRTSKAPGRKIFGSISSSWKSFVLSGILVHFLVLL